MASDGRENAYLALPGASLGLTAPRHDFPGAGSLSNGQCLVNIPFNTSVFLMLILKSIHCLCLGKEIFVDF